MLLKSKSIVRGRQVPLIVEKGEDNFYVAECPLFSGCYAQGKTIAEALQNIREVIDLVLEEELNRRFMKLLEK